MQDWDWILGSEPQFNFSEKHSCPKRIQALIYANCVNQSEHTILFNGSFYCLELLANGRGSCAAGWFGQKENANWGSLCHSPLDRAHFDKCFWEFPTSSPSPPFKVYLRLCHGCCSLNPHVPLLIPVVSWMFTRSYYSSRWFKRGKTEHIFALLISVINIFIVMMKLIFVGCLVSIFLQECDGHRN